MRDVAGRWADYSLPTRFRLNFILKASGEVFQRWNKLGFINLGVCEPKRSQVWCPGSWLGQLEGGSAILRENTTRSTGVFEGDKKSRSKVHSTSLSLSLGDWQEAQGRIPKRTPTSRSPATRFPKSGSSRARPLWPAPPSLCSRKPGVTSASPWPPLHHSCIRYS